jgi:(S)-2-hydroxyglutarate dehydrogenase
MTYDYIIIGGGIVGLATGYALTNQQPNSKILILEKEPSLAAHQTGRNSGVIHSGIYYKPDSLKARFAKEGGKKLIKYCEENSIQYDICGKLIVATEEYELIELNKLYDRGIQNGLKIQLIDKDELKELEPHANGISAIKVPMAGIVNYKQISESLADKITARGGEIKVSTKVVDIKEKNEEIEVETDKGSFKAKYLINCAGLFSDRITKMAGMDPKMKIVPFRGEYFKLKESKSYLVKNLIYPVPDPQFPFLGVHLTRMINGEIHVGPNAVLAFKREGYKKTDLDINDLLETLSYPAFWKIARKHLRYGLSEMHRSISKNKFLESLQRLVPEVNLEDLVKTEAGVRAQALTYDGKLVDDFIILKSKRSIHVCNAPSPAATASLAIGEEIVTYLESLLTV